MNRIGGTSTSSYGWDSLLVARFTAVRDDFWRFAIET